MAGTQKASTTFVGVNVTTPLTGMNPAIVSVRMWLWPSVTDRSAETTSTLAHFMELEGYDARSGAGTIVFAKAGIDTSPQTCFQVFGQTALEPLLRAAFPAPTVD